MIISIIIPTNNRKFFLENCLKSLWNQTYPQNQYEILVVDDGSTDGTGAIVKGLKAIKNLKYFYQPHRGLSEARNLGVKSARGKIVAFIDDDCVADKNWVSLIVKTYRRSSPKVGGIGGQVFVGTYKKNIIARAGQAMLNYSVSRHKKGNEVLFLLGSNFSFRKEVLNKIGYFDRDFRTAGDDTEFAWRLVKAGYKLIYEPKIKVEHFQRNTLISFWKQNIEYGTSLCLSKRKHPDLFYVKSGPVINLKRYFEDFFIFPFRMTLFFKKRPEKVMVLFLSFLRQIAFYSGIIDGKLRPRGK